MVIINELLAYAQHHISASAIDNAKRMTIVFYNEDEIINAKKVLYDNREDKLGPFPARKNTDIRKATVAHVDDIFNGLKTIDSLNAALDVVARDLDKLPDRQPEELNLLLTIQRVADIEKLIKQHGEVLSTHAIDLIDLKQGNTQPDDRPIGTTADPPITTPQPSVVAVANPPAAAMPSPITTVPGLPADMPSPEVNEALTNIVPPAVTVAGPSTAMQSPVATVPGPPAAMPPPGATGTPPNDSPQIMTPPSHESRSYAAAAQQQVNNNNLGGNHGQRNQWGNHNNSRDNYGQHNRNGNHNNNRDNHGPRQHQPSYRDNGFGRSRPSSGSWRDRSHNDHSAPRPRTHHHPRPYNDNNSNYRQNERPPPIVDEDGFQVVQNNRRRRVDGSSSIAVEGFRGGPPPPKHIWLSRVEEGDVTAIRNYLEMKRIPVKDITMTSHIESKYKSFKISIDAKDVGRVFATNLWPTGVRLQHWKGTRRSNNNNRAGNVIGNAANPTGNVNANGNVTDGANNNVNDNVNVDANSANGNAVNDAVNDRPQGSVN